MDEHDLTGQAAAWDATFKFLMFGCTIASFQFILTLLYYIALPDWRFVTKWLFIFPVIAWLITFIVFAIMMFKIELNSLFTGSGK